jgi:hypothetical protein
MLLSSSIRDGPLTWRVLSRVEGSRRWSGLLLADGAATVAVRPAHMDDVAQASKYYQNRTFYRLDLSISREIYPEKYEKQIPKCVIQKVYTIIKKAQLVRMQHTIWHPITIFYARHNWWKLWAFICRPANIVVHVCSYTCDRTASTHTWWCLITKDKVTCEHLTCHVHVCDDV